MIDIPNNYATHESPLDDPPKDRAPEVHGAPKRYTRFEAIGIAALAFGSAAVAGRKLRPDDQPSAGDNSSYKDTFTAAPIETADIQLGDIEVFGGSAPVFEDENAQDIARENGVSTMSLVEGYYELGEQFTAFTRPDLLPTHYAQVYEYKDMLYDLQEQSGVQVNVIAMIAGIESGGNPQAMSEAGAVGMFQLTELHLVQIDQNGGDRDDTHDQGIQAMNYFKNECLVAARRYLGLPEDEESASAYIRAMAMYNAGPSGGSKDYSELADETLQYMHHTRRSIQIAEIAAGLRDAGYSDRDIVESLRSPSVDARAYALQHSDVSATEEVLSYLASDPLREPSTADEMALWTLYNEYENGVYSVPLNPALRMHGAVAQTFILGTDYPGNRDPDNYYNLDTSD